jgi:hypothetical protein
MTMRIKQDALLYDSTGRPCVTLSEAARRRDISRQAISKAVAEKRLETVTVGNLQVVPVEVLMRWQPDRGRSKRARKAHAAATK